MKKLLILAMLAACGSKSDKPADNAAGGDACTTATAKAVDEMMGARIKRMEQRASSGSDMGDRKAKLEEQATQLKGVLAKRCNDDKWSQDVIDCYSNAANRDAVQACVKKLPQDQQQALMADEMKVMTAGRSGGMMGVGGHRNRNMDGSADVPGSGSAVPATGSGSAASVMGSGSAAPATGSGSAAPAGSGSAK